MPHLGRLLIDIPLILIAFGLCETMIGKAKTAWVSLITTLGGIALGMGLCSLSAGKSPQWHAISHDGAILGPLVVVVGTLMCASAFTAMLWRRRIRVIGYSVVLIMFLYRGEASDYCLLAAALIGHVLGYLMASASQGDVYRHMVPCTRCAGWLVWLPAYRRSVRWLPFPQDNHSDCSPCSAC